MPTHHCKQSCVIASTPCRTTSLVIRRSVHLCARILSKTDIQRVSIIINLKNYHTTQNWVQRTGESSDEARGSILSHYVTWLGCRKGLGMKGIGFDSGNSTSDFNSFQLDLCQLLCIRHWWNQWLVVGRGWGSDGTLNPMKRGSWMFVLNWIEIDSGILWHVKAAKWYEGCQGG